MDVVFLDEMRCESCLAEVDLDEFGRGHPLKVCTKKPFNHAHESNRSMLIKKTFKFGFHCWVLQEVDKVINIKAKS
jgi:hypothetical protein